MSEHHAEVFTEDGLRTWGWHCLTCGEVSVDRYVFLGNAQIAADDHERSHR
jgi:hypothetical protein